jgi:hypothetical protein
MKVKKRKLSPAATAGVGVGVTLVVALLGWFLLVSPQRSRAADFDAQIVLVEQQISEARAAALQASDSEPIKAADLFRLTKAMPSDNDIAGVLLELSRVASETGIQFDQIVPQPTLSAGAFRAQPIELVFTGNFYALSDFLYRMRNLVSVQRGRLLANGRLFSVDKIQFVEADSHFPNIKAILGVSAYLYGTSQLAGAPPVSSAAPAGATPTDTTGATTPTDTTATTTDTTATTTPATTTPSPDTPPAAPEAVGP